MYKKILLSKALFFRHIKQTSKNIVDTTSKFEDNSTNLSLFNLIFPLNIQPKKNGESHKGGYAL